jgi:hypothetical protein
MKYPDVEDLRRVGLKGPNLRHQDVFHSVGMQQYCSYCTMILFKGLGALHERILRSMLEAHAAKPL